MTIEKMTKLQQSRVAPGANTRAAEEVAGPPTARPPTSPSPSACRGAALHLARWMRSHPGGGSAATLLEEPEPEIWSTEQLKKRSQELKLLDKGSTTATIGLPCEPNKSPSEHERSPSRSTNSDSQITVRSSPVVPETVAVCRQCHKRCFSKPGSPQVSSAAPITGMRSSSSPTNNGFLAASHTCSKTYTENKNECIARCAKDNCIAETRITSSPVKVEVKEEINAPKEERISPRAAIRRSREEFFKNSISKDNSTSPLDRLSKSPSSQSPSSQRSSGSSRSTLFSTNSLMSFANTTCSSMAFSTSNSKNTQSPGRDSMASGSSDREEKVQYVIAQEKYLNEVKCVENVVLKNTGTRARLKDIKTFTNVSRTFAETMNNSASPKTQTNKYLASNSYPKENINLPLTSFNSDFLSGTPKKAVNGDIRKCVSDENSTYTEATTRSSINFSWSPLMLMGLSSMNPAAHLFALDPESERDRTNSSPRHPCRAPNTSPTKVPNISVVPPTPDFKSDNKTMMTQHTLEDSPDDSPIAEDLPYTALKRYGTMSSLERLPSDELDDIQLANHQQIAEKDSEASQGLFSWTSRAGSYVAEKMALLNSLAESGAASTGASFLERYLGTGEWRAVRGSVSGAEGSGGEGSGASGEEAWGTPSSGDLSDHAFPDSDHATLSSPTKSSSSCPGDDDTELMMDELLMTPPIAGPSLRPLLPRRRLEPLLEEEGSDTSSTSSAGGSEVTPSPTDKQESRAVAEVSGGAADGGDWPGAREIEDPELTPTNGPPEHASLLLSNVLHAVISTGRRGSSSGSEGTLAPPEAPSPAAGEPPQAEDTENSQRLSPRMEMRLALQEGRDILAEQDRLWDQVSGRCGWVRRPLPRSPRPVPLHVHQPTITSHSSVSAQQGEVKLTAMERLALLEARGGRRGSRRVRPTARLIRMPRRFRDTSSQGTGNNPEWLAMGLVRRRASSDSPERRPYSPRRQQPHVSSHGYYKICFVNGFV